ncbi:hypothetical protein PR048_012297 [Dryococelus australis]|uniref:Uncharacterized protein n=1 Tax=Dryococelus australis TaxID=614101 RepID=A0ABQ9HQ90_9NEOP|nr:hypothetical protein PR048_012297 [Dryococelus australis]
MVNRLLLEGNDFTFDKACQIVLNMDSANQSLNIELNSKFIMFDVDTRSACTVIPLNIFKQWFSDDKLEKIYGKLLAANDQPLHVLGRCIVNVRFNKYFGNLSLIETLKKCHRALLGRDWLDILIPSWRHEFSESTGHVCNDNTIDEVMSVCSVKSHMVKDLELKIPAAFNKENNEDPIEQFKVNINVKDNCVPIFCKEYDGPYALRDSASPIVCVLKKNGEIRLCVDLKVTLNKYVSVDLYPLPKTKDLFKKFNEFNLEVDESSRYITLFVGCMSIIVCFGLSSASAIFQSVTDKILEVIKYCGAYKDDILLGVLSHLNDYNVNIKIQKSEFFVKSLEMLGYVLSADGLSPCKSKIKS